MDWYLTLAGHLVIIVGILSAFLGVVMLVVYLAEVMSIGTLRLKSIRPEPRGFEVMPPSKMRPRAR